MDPIRKLGICIVMMIPAFVFSGLIWEFFDNWWVVFGTIALVLGVCILIISGKFSRKEKPI